MHLSIGTSGFSYKQWKGDFYPEDLPQNRFLEHYATQLSAVEINNTFYRMPKLEMLEGWREKVGEGFEFALKASRKITHFKKLKNCGEEVAYLAGNAAALGPHLGPILFQLPPNFGFDLDRLTEFLSDLPNGLRCAFEFRHQDWLQSATWEALAEVPNQVQAAVCIADYGNTEWDEIPDTADFAYFRLRATSYDDEELARWAGLAAATGTSHLYAFLKHDDGLAPRLAKRFGEMVGERLGV